MSALRDDLAFGHIQIAPDAKHHLAILERHSRALAKINAAGFAEIQRDLNRLTAIRIRAQLASAIRMQSIWI